MIKPAGVSGFRPGWLVSERVRKRRREEEEEKRRIRTKK